MTFVKAPISAVLTDLDGYTISTATPLPVDPAESGTASFATGQVSIPTTPITAIVAARAARRAVLITNTHATAILYVGGAAVTSSTGQAVPAGVSLTFPTVAAVYGVASATLTASFVEVYD
jgi:hypothetical protein